MISGNREGGIRLSGPDSTRNVLAGNFIGTDETGEAGIDDLGRSMGNGLDGILLTSAGGNLIGGPSADSRNLIDDNLADGVAILGLSEANVLSGNWIGLDALGIAPLGNLGDGVFVNGSGFNQIGSGTLGNVISGNLGNGVRITDNTIPGTSPLLQGFNEVQGNFLGTTAFGGPATVSGLAVPAAVPNGLDGILIDNALGDLIGGPGGGDLGQSRSPLGNVISGNAQNGIHVRNSVPGGDQSRRVVIQGNDVGLDASGTSPVPNGVDGIFLDNSGSVEVADNLVSANRQNGVDVLSGPLGAPDASHTILHNRIGTDFLGTAPLGNGAAGVFINNSSDNVIGGINPTTNTTPSLGNVISANLGAGIVLEGDLSTGDLVLGNFLGTDASGTAALGNPIGVYLLHSSGNTIGSAQAGAGNVISGNLAEGVRVEGGDSLSNLVVGNRIGTDPAGSLAVGNLTGVAVVGAAGTTIGGLSAGSGNVISGNSAAGISIQAGAAETIVEGNVLGLGASGESLLVGPDGRPVVADSARQQAGVVVDSSPGTVLGGPSPSARNVISGNRVGVVLESLNPFAPGQPAGALGTIVQGNFIGPGASGAAGTSVGNRFGVYIDGSTFNLIGGTAHGEGNVISGNSAAGIELFGNLAAGNLVEGNSIGTDAAGSGSLPNGSGVYIEGARPFGFVDPTNPQARPTVLGNTIGGKAAGAGNLIAHNAAGVYLFGGAAGNSVVGNRILDNTSYGILLFNSAGNSDDASAKGNTVRGNTLADFREYTGPTTPRTDPSAAPPSQPIRRGRAHRAAPGSKASRPARHRRASAAVEVGSPVPGGPLRRGL